MPIEKTEDGRLGPGVQCVERVMQILKLFDSCSQMALGEIANKADLPKSTAHRLVNALVKGGFLEQDPGSRCYQLGAAFLRFAFLVKDRMDIREIALPYLRELRDKCEETVHLSIFENYGVVCIEKLESPHTVRMHSYVGKRGDAHCSSSGKILLASLSSESIDAYIKDHGLNRRTQNTIVDPHELKRHLKEAFERGWAFDNEENEESIRCVAAPIVDGNESTIAAVSIAGPSFRVTLDKVQELASYVTETAGKISFSLGATVQSKQ